MFSVKRAPSVSELGALLDQYRPLIENLNFKDEIPLVFQRYFALIQACVHLDLQMTFQALQKYIPNHNVMTLMPNADAWSILGITNYLDPFAIPIFVQLIRQHLINELNRNEVCEMIPEQLREHIQNSKQLLTLIDNLSDTQIIALCFVYQFREQCTAFTKELRAAQSVFHPGYWVVSNKSHKFKIITELTHLLDAHRGQPLQQLIDINLFAHQMPELYDELQLLEIPRQKPLQQSFNDMTFLPSVISDAKQISLRELAVLQQDKPMIKQITLG